MFRRKNRHTVVCETCNKNYPLHVQMDSALESFNVICKSCKRTGLKDNNGKAIYIGDVIQISSKIEKNSSKKTIEQEIHEALSEITIKK